MHFLVSLYTNEIREIRPPSYVSLYTTLYTTLYNIASYIVYDILNAIQRRLYMWYLFLVRVLLLIACSACPGGMFHFKQIKSEGRATVPETPDFFKEKGLNPHFW